jgi:hypothetical protein
MVNLESHTSIDIKTWFRVFTSVRSNNDLLRFNAQLSLESRENDTLLNSALPDTDEQRMTYSNFSFWFHPNLCVSDLAAIPEIQWDLLVVLNGICLHLLG